MRTLILTAAVLAATPALAEVTLGRPAIGCVDRDTAKLAQDLINQGDSDALDELVLPHIVRGTCVPLRSGTPVRLMEVPLFDSMSQIRLQGSAQLLWVPGGAIDVGG